MAYCRFSDADVYIYDDIHHGIICAACSLMPLKETDLTLFGEYERYFINPNFVVDRNYDQMLEHIKEHREAGDYVPEYVDRILILERDCTHEWQGNGYCKLCWKDKEQYIEGS
jgi:hypothetical protein